MNTLSDIEVYNLLLHTVNIISKTKYVRFFALKGGMVLMSKLFEYNRTDMFRRTSDIDIHCSSKDIWFRFCNECEAILNIDEAVQYRLIKRRSATKGLSTSDSLVFEVSLRDGRVIKIGMDMNIKSNDIVEVSFDPVLQMHTYSEYTMLVDKIAVVSSGKVYRRIKDLYDICVLASLYQFQLDKIVNMLRVKHNKEPKDLENMLSSENFGNLAHAYSCFVGIVNKPDIMVLLDIAQKFLYPLYNGVSTGYIWNNRSCLWEKC